MKIAMFQFNVFKETILVLNLKTSESKQTELISIFGGSQFKTRLIIWFIERLYVSL